MTETNIIIGGELERTIFQSLGTLFKLLLEAHDDTVLQVNPIKLHAESSQFYCQI